MKRYEIRADYDRETLVVYQAYRPEIASAAVAAQRFVPPFSLERMTWIKPSFLWMMERSGWGRKAGQEHILAVRIRRSGWDEALGQAELTHPAPRLYANADQWRERFEQAPVHVQWDPERSLRGAKLEERSIQVGLSRHIVRRYVDEWTVGIEDVTPLVRKLADLCERGLHDKARALLPRERAYPTSDAVKQRLGMD